MSKLLFLLSNGESVKEARMMTMEEVRQAQIEEDKKGNNSLFWYGPFDVKEPATLQFYHTNKQSVHDRHGSIH